MEQFNNRESFNFSKLQDYRRSGYDRGHLVSAVDMAFSEQKMADSFFMSNISPQRAAINRGIWKDLEALVRYFAITERKIVVGRTLSDFLRCDTTIPEEVKSGTEENSKFSLNQNAGDAKGAFIPLKNMESIIYFFSGKSDASTLVHELAHHHELSLSKILPGNIRQLHDLFVNIDFSFWKVFYISNLDILSF